MRINNPPSFARISAHLIIGAIIAAFEYKALQGLGFDGNFAFVLSFLFLILFAVIAILKEMFFS